MPHEIKLCWWNRNYKFNKKYCTTHSVFQLTRKLYGTCTRSSGSISSQSISRCLTNEYISMFENRMNGVLKSDYNYFWIFQFPSENFRFLEKNLRKIIFLKRRNLIVGHRKWMIQILWPHTPFDFSFWNSKMRRGETMLTWYNATEMEWAIFRWYWLRMDWRINRFLYTTNHWWGGLFMHAFSWCNTILRCFSFSVRE